MKKLKLRRVPQLPQDDLTATQAADDLLVERFFQLNPSSETQVLILEDHFGSITTQLVAQRHPVHLIHTLCDSMSSEEALKSNLYRNQLPAPTIDSELDKLLSKISLDRPLIILTRWYKSLRLWKSQLQELRMSPLSNTTITCLSAGMIKHYNYQYRDIAQEIFGNSDLSRIHKKARILSWEIEAPAQSHNPQGQAKESKALAGFNQGKVDQASQLLIDHLAEVVYPELPGRARIADLGAGTGALGRALFDHIPCRIDFIEDSQLSLNELQAQLNQDEKMSLDDYRILRSNCFETQELEDSQYDLIISNPPYHQFHTLTPSLVSHFIKEALKHLKPQGTLIWVTSSKINPPHSIVRGKRPLSLLAEGHGHSAWTLGPA